MITSRQRILNYIIEQQSTTVEELSRAYKVTPANIRHHLAILVEQGSVTIIGQMAPHGKGRPAQIYGSRQHNDQNNLDKLAEALLLTLFSISRTEEKSILLDKIASYLAKENKTDNINPTRRLYTTINVLNRLNYQAHWEAHILNPRIMFGHCPYQAIIKDHPELCQVDAALLERLSGIPVRQVEKQAMNIKGYAQCVFLLNQSA